MVQEVQVHVLWYLVQVSSAVLPCLCSEHRPLMDEVRLPDGTVQRNGRQKEMALSGLYPPRLGHAIISAWQQRQVSASWTSQLQPQGPGPAVQQSTWRNNEPDPWAEQPPQGQ